MKRLESCKKIGILGGTFNPVHVGHLMMAEYAKEAVGLDMVLFIPTGISYLKKSGEILSGELRKKILDMSIEDNPYFVSSDIELKRAGNTYTYETLLELSELYPQAQLYFLLGADCLFSIENWVKPEQIFAHCILIAANRNHTAKEAMESKKQELEQRFGAKILLLDFPMVDISSTEIRKRLQCGISVRYMVHDAVCEYLKKTNAYKLKLTEDECHEKCRYYKNSKSDGKRTGWKTV